MHTHTHMHTHQYIHTIDLVDIAKFIRKLILNFDEQFSDPAAII